MTSTDPDSADLHLRLEAARHSEKEQALRYRWLAARAETDAHELAERFHDLHADEQHHLSRLTARLLELGGRPEELGAVSAPPVDLATWRDDVPRWEAAEIEMYGSLLMCELDDVTRALIEEILATEKHHARDLGGKWTLA